MSRYRWIDARKAEGFPVAAAAVRWPRSPPRPTTTGSARSAGPTDAEWDEAILVNEMREIHDDLDDTYGSPRMTDELARRGFCVNHKRVERLMAPNGLYAKDGRRKKCRTTIPDVSAPPLPDLVKRDFSVGAPGERTCGDITYVPTDEGWLYLADVVDLGSRRIVGFAMADHMRTELVAGAMDMAIAARGGDVAGMIFHHDRGAQYMSASSAPSASITASTSRPDAPARAWTTRWPRASGPPSSESSSAAAASPRGPRLAGPSSPGSTTTTRCACTARSATSRRSSGNCAITARRRSRSPRPHETVLSDRSCGAQIHRPGSTTMQIAQSARTISPTSTCPAGGGKAKVPAWTGRWRSPRGDQWFRVWACPDHLDGLTGLREFGRSAEGCPRTAPWGQGRRVR